MKKITTLLLITITSICLSGCGSKDATIDRLSKSLETVTNSSEQHLAEIEKLENQKLEFMATIDELEAEIVELKANNQQLNEKNDDSQNVTTCTVNYEQSDSYLAMKFWSDGQNYIGSKVVTWYSDYYCSQSITSNVIIVSPTIDRLTLSNGHTVYVCMSSNGLVFSTDYPYLLLQTD